MPESQSVWKRFWSHFEWLDSIDVLLYGGLGLALLGYAIYTIASILQGAGQITALLVFLSVVGLSLAALIRDLRRKQLSLLSKVFAGAWALCVALVIVVELVESFS